MNHANHPYFFLPRKGNLYEKGFEKLKTLVVGAHHICTHDCLHKAICSSSKKVWLMDLTCPIYEGRDKSYYRLSNSNEIEIESFIEGEAKYPSYSAFTYYMLRLKDRLTSEQKASFWESVTFTNFLQHWRPNDETPQDPEIFEVDYPAFLQMVDNLDPKPEVVYVWNPMVRDCLRHHPEDFKYIGLADIHSQLSVYVFTPRQGELTGNRLRKLRYDRGIESINFSSKWYEKLVSKHLGKSIPSDPNLSYNIKKLAEKLKDLVEAQLLGASDEDLYFRNSECMTWRTYHMGYFLKVLKDNYHLGIGANAGIAAMMNQKGIEKYSNDPRKLQPKDEIKSKIDSIIYNHFRK